VSRLERAIIFCVVLALLEESLLIYLIFVPKLWLSIVLISIAWINPILMTDFIISNKYSKTPQRYYVYIALMLCTASQIYLIAPYVAGISFLITLRSFIFLYALVMIAMMVYFISSSRYYERDE